VDSRSDPHQAPGPAAAVTSVTAVTAVTSAAVAVAVVAVAVAPSRRQHRVVVRVDWLEEPADRLPGPPPTWFSTRYEPRVDP
jgi:hypothetical protein